MRFVSVSYHVPDPNGSAAGRVLFATVEGLLEDGHDVSVVSWRPEEPAGALPGWCTWVPFPASSRIRSRTVGLLKPRNESATLDVAVPEGAIAVAEDFLSYPAVAGVPKRALTVHNLTTIDARVIGRRRLADLQSARAEGRAVRRAPLVLASSARVAGSLPEPADVVPIAYPVPLEPLDHVSEPVAVTIADWRWPPNRWALDRLLSAWGGVREAVAGARLLLAGRGLEPVGSIPGVDVLGPVASSTEVLRRAAVLAFPCPPTTGPKIKVLEALAHGVPAVTTAAGVEGLSSGDGALTPDIHGFAAALTEVLLDPERARTLGLAGREAVTRSHSPRAAGRRRVDACRRAFELDPSAP